MVYVNYLRFLDTIKGIIMYVLSSTMVAIILNDEADGFAVLWLCYVGVPAPGLVRGCSILCK